MTDKEMLLAMCKRLKARRIKPENFPSEIKKAYCVDDDAIWLGAGSGYKYFHCEFKFDSDGMIIGWGCWE